MTKKRDFERGSGNVFADLGLKEAEELQARAELIQQINKIIKQRGLTQNEVAATVGLSQADVSLLTRGTVTRFSTERIMRVLLRLGRDIEIVVKPKPRSRAEAQVKVRAA
jgi:predicted XRE-type DNA-binding protein